MRTTRTLAGTLFTVLALLTATLGPQATAALAQDGLAGAGQEAPTAQPDADQNAGPARVENYPDAVSLPELVARQSQPDTLTEQLKCLAGAIYFEAKGETLAGQLAVARVIVTRASSGRFPGSYCGVVYQPSQFAFVQGRHMPPVRALSTAWHEAVAIAQIADRGSWRSAAEGALYFHAARVTPKWRLTRIARVDDHVFYR